MSQTSIINRQATADVPRREAAARAATVSATRLAWRRRIAKAARWLHIYGSMMSLALVLFFALTGITLNHPGWFAGQEVTSERRGEMATSWLTGSVDKLQVVEYLRANAGIHGALADFRIDDQQCEVVFKGPGYAATAVVERATGSFDLTESRFGLAATVNDLHKGRDTGPVWGVVIDLSGAVLVFVSLTGLILLYFVHRYRVAGAILLGLGALTSYMVYAIWVP